MKGLHVSTGRTDVSSEILCWLLPQAHCSPPTGALVALVGEARWWARAGRAGGQSAPLSLATSSPPPSPSVFVHPSRTHTALSHGKHQRQPPWLTSPFHCFSSLSCADKSLARHTMSYMAISSGPYATPT